MGIKYLFDKMFGVKIEFSMVRTKGGDDGKSGLYSGGRTFKSAPEFQVLGDIDELNASIGVLRNIECPIPIKADLKAIQNILINLSTIVATSPTSENYIVYPVDDFVLHLESMLKLRMKDVKLPSYFVHYGEKGITSAQFDLTRAICRRAERTLVGFIKDLDFDWYDIKQAQKYINCLSDYLWVCARRVEV